MNAQCTASALASPACQTGDPYDDHDRDQIPYGTGME